jgi:hypothetical protein
MSKSMFESMFIQYQHEHEQKNRNMNTLYMDMDTNTDTDTDTDTYKDMDTYMTVYESKDNFQFYRNVSLLINVGHRRSGTALESDMLLFLLHILLPILCCSPSRLPLVTAPPPPHFLPYLVRLIIFPADTHITFRDDVFWLIDERGKIRGIMR